MKQLTCEMCGSTELVKEDGFFVCQTCRTKYSVEEAKKMMIEGTVEVTGTVQIDRNNEIENKLKNAIREFEANNLNIAFSLLSDILNIDPNNYEAIIYKALALGWQTSINNPKIAIVTREFQRAFQLKKEQTDNIFDFSRDIIPALNLMKEFGKACFTLHENELNRGHQKFKKQISDAQTHAQEIASFDYTRGKSYLHSEISAAQADLDKLINATVAAWDNITKCMSMVGGEVIILIDSNWNAACEDLLPCIEEYMNVTTTHCKEDDVSAEAISTCEKIKGIIKSIKKQVLEHKKQEQKKRIDQYWIENPDQKASLDAKLKSIESNLKNAEQKLNTTEKENQIAIEKLEKERNACVPSDSDKIACEKRIADMESEYTTLGFFKMKDKKALREKIDNEKNRLYEINLKIKQEKRELSTKIDAQINSIKSNTDPIHEEINKLISQEKEIKKLLKTANNTIKQEFFYYIGSQEISEESMEQLSVLLENEGKLLKAVGLVCELTNLSFEEATKWVALYTADAININEKHTIPLNL